MPFADARFDAVVSNFGFIHFPRPEVALAQTARVLRAGGRLAFTAWNHDAGHRTLMERAMREHGEPGVPLVAGPPAPFYDDARACARTLQAAGFAAPETVELTLCLRAQTPAHVIDVIEKSTVRTAARLKAQTPEARERIKRAIAERLGEFACGGMIQVPMGARLIHAQKR